MFCCPLVEAAAGVEERRGRDVDGERVVKRDRERLRERETERD